jgi:hypothetical protein
MSGVAFRRKAIIAAILWFVGTISTGCAQLCPATIVIGTSKVAESDQASLEHFAAAVSEAVSPLGFSPDQAPRDLGFGFSKHESGYEDNMFSRYKRVDINISFSDPTTLWIAIKDYGTRNESPIVKSAEDAIGQTFASRLGITVKFKPSCDLS